MSSGTGRQLQEVNKHCSRAARQGSCPKTWGASSSLLSSKHFSMKHIQVPHLSLLAFSVTHTMKTWWMHILFDTGKQRCTYSWLIWNSRVCFSPKTVWFRQMWTLIPFRGRTNLGPRSQRKGGLPSLPIKVQHGSFVARQETNPTQQICSF